MSIRRKIVRLSLTVCTGALVTLLFLRNVRGTTAPPSPFTVNSVVQQASEGRPRARRPESPLPPQFQLLGAHALPITPSKDALGKIRARVPDLDAALELEEENRTWAETVLTRAREVLPVDAEIKDLDVRCAQTFCRLRLVIPRASAAVWPEIDRALTPVADGEAMFNTEEDGDTSTAYLYFSAHDSHLPLGETMANNEDG